MTVLVTGATGLLGSHVVDALLDRRETVRALVRPEESLNGLADAPVEVFWGDVADEVAVTKAVAGVDIVIHCAARTGPWGPVAEYERTNVLGLRRLLDASLQSGVKRFVHVSSITVHGNDVGGVADETSPFREEPNPYTRTKIAGERLIESAWRDSRAPVTIVRPGWIYGPRDRSSFGRFATMIQRGGMVVVGSGRNHVPLIYVEDVARGVLRAADAPAAAGKAYLLVNDEPVTQLDYLGAIADELGVPAPRRHVPYRLALTLGAAAETAGRVMHRTEPPPLMRYGLQLLGGDNRFDITRARFELGFAPQVGVADGVKESMRWFRNPSAQTGRVEVAS